MNKQPKKNDDEPQEIKITAQSDITKGVYSNVALIRHTQNEFVIDFLLQFDGSAQLVSRVIFSPSHMRAFKNAIDVNLKKFEDSHGKDSSTKKLSSH
jgi:hypothetical protein